MNQAPFTTRLFLFIAGLALLAALPSNFLARAQEGTEAEEGAATYEDLQEKIKSRTTELEQINSRLEEVEKNLKETQGQRQSLQSQVKTLDYSINQLGLNIRSDEITAQKLGFEIESLQYDIRGIEMSVDDKKKGIEELLRELYKNDRKNLLLVFLENKSLSGGLAEVESLGNVRSQLVADIANLQNLSNLYESKLGEVQGKRSEVVVRQANLKNRKLVAEDQKKERQSLVAVTKNKESTYQKELAELQKQQDAISDEISKFEDELRASFDPSLLPVKRSGVFEWPVASRRITQHFGEVSKLYRGRPHNGMDIGVPVGTPVFAAEDGVVLAVDNNDKAARRNYQYGRYILIKHNNNLATLYAHLSRQIVQKGESVVRGQTIGYSGGLKYSYGSGYSTGPHIHLTAYWAPSIIFKSGAELKQPFAGYIPIGVVIDPEDYL